MQIIFKNENERSCSREADSVNIVIYIRGLSRYLERKHVGRFKSRSFGV